MMVTSSCTLTACRYLYQDGTIGMDIKLTGILSTSVLSPGESNSTHGTMVGQGVNAAHHQHLFSARLDMAVDDDNGGRNLIVSEVWETQAAEVLMAVAACMLCCGSAGAHGNTVVKLDAFLQLHWHRSHMANGESSNVCAAFGGACQSSSKPAFARSTDCAGLHSCTPDSLRAAAPKVGAVVLCCR